MDGRTHARRSLTRCAGQTRLSFAATLRQAIHGTPAAFVENLRLDEARRRLSERTQTIENVASSVGFQSDDVFRRAFQRRFGVKPSSYRSQFDARTKSRSRRT